MLAFLLGACLGLAGCVAGTGLTPASAPLSMPEPVTPSAGAGRPAAPLGSDFSVVRLPGAAPGVSVLALHRPARVAPLRYRVVVLPGSGCAGMGPLAARYFAGLLHAEVWVLHKPGVHPDDRRGPDRCPGAFVQADALGAWQAHAQAALQALAPVWGGASAGGVALPTVLVGISEGAELLPGLAAAVQPLAGLVLLGSSGLDPREAGALQAQRLGQSAAWQALGQQVRQEPQGPPVREYAPGASADLLPVLQGRSMRYWQDLWRWPLAQPLIDGPWPLWQFWGEADALVPAEAYARFAARARSRAAPYCARSFPGADHGLQTPGDDGVQRVWAWLEHHVRQAAALQASGQRGRYILNSCSGPTVK